MEPFLANVGEPTPWQTTKASLIRFGFRLLEAVAKALALIVLIFVHRGVDWALATAFAGVDWATYHRWLEGGAFVGFSLVYVMLMCDIAILFWPFLKR